MSISKSLKFEKTLQKHQNTLISDFIWNNQYSQSETPLSRCVSVSSLLPSNFLKLTAPSSLTNWLFVCQYIIESLCTYIQ